MGRWGISYIWELYFEKSYFNIGTIQILGIEYEIVALNLEKLRFWVLSVEHNDCTQHRPTFE